MSIRIKSYIKKYKYEVIGVLLLPFGLYIVNIFLQFFHQIGIYIGIFFRNLYEIIV